METPRDERGGLPEAPRTGWNELQFLSWRQCQEMAPTILQLEITRIGRLIQSPAGRSDFRNSLVRARFELEECVLRLGQASKETARETCLPHLHVAIMLLSVPPAHLDDRTRETCGYVLDRLNHVVDRIRLIY